MNDAEKEFWAVIDQAIFRVKDPNTIRQKAAASGAAWLKSRSTLGGALKQIRLMRNELASDCARKAGVTQAQWQAWESDRETPSDEELAKLCKRFEFGERKKQRLLGLRKKAPRQRLLMMSRLRPELLAARGVAKVETSLEWQKLPEEIRYALIEWGRDREIMNAKDMFEAIQELKDEDARLIWVDEVLSYLV